MHSAPAVSYPVGRSRGAAWLLIVIWGLGACCAGLSCYMSDGFGWRQPLMLASVVLAGLAASFGLRHDSRAAELRFDGTHWSLAGAAPARALHAAQQIAVGLDFQSLLLLRLHEAGRPSRWLWLERRAMPERWRDLRRAVYSRAPSAALAADSRRA
jgi:toxin CptA